jgi:hypothetical protein
MHTSPDDDGHFTAPVALGLSEHRCVVIFAAVALFGLWPAVFARRAMLAGKGSALTT